VALTGSGVTGKAVIEEALYSTEPAGPGQVLCWLGARDVATIVREIEREYDPEELQQMLGDHHDSVVARTVLLDLAAKARASGQDTFSYGLLYESQVCQAAKIDQALPGLAAPASDTTARSPSFVNHQG